MKIRLKRAFAALMLAVSIFLTHGVQAKQPLYCSFVLQKDITRFHCDVNQHMPAFHPRPGPPDGPGSFKPLYPGSSLCRVYGVPGLHEGTLASCPTGEEGHP